MPALISSAEADEDEIPALISDDDEIPDLISEEAFIKHNM
jgi:hypothetical protein